MNKLSKKNQLKGVDLMIVLSPPEGGRLGLEEKVMGNAKGVGKTGVAGLRQPTLTNVERRALRSSYVIRRKKGYRG